VFEVLKRYGIRQKDLAEIFEVSESIISLWARGIKPIPEGRLHDLWALASFARAAVIAGGSGRDACHHWSATAAQGGWIWQTSKGHVPGWGQALRRKWDYPTVLRVLLQPGGSEAATLDGAQAAFQWYVDRVVNAVQAKTLPAADDLEALRQVVEIVRRTVHQLQERVARQPLPMDTAPEEPHHAEEALEGRTL
jgi:hypothetical protein